MTLVIPEQLKNYAFRFIRIDMDGPMGRKKPLDSDWQHTNNFVYFDQTLTNWTTRNNNYGIACGYGNLAVIDADDDAIAFIVESRLPKTFTVKTGSGGKHFYYIIPDLEKKIVLKDKDGIHYGEIQWRGSQVIGPNSMHPNGNTYTVVSDIPIATITDQHIKEIFADYIPQQTAGQYSGENNYQYVDMSKIINLDNLRPKNGEFVGKHPVHGSHTGGNFSINMEKGVWHCFRCGTGGGPITLIAMMNGLIQCSDSRPGVITNELYQQIVKLAKEKYGIVIE